jgi:hypothetical protein
MYAMNVKTSLLIFAILVSTCYAEEMRDTSRTYLQALDIAFKKIGENSKSMKKKLDKDDKTLKQENKDVPGGSPYTLTVQKSSSLNAKINQDATIDARMRSGKITGFSRSIPATKGEQTCYLELRLDWEPPTFRNGSGLGCLINLSVCGKRYAIQYNNEKKKFCHNENFVTNQVLYLEKELNPGKFPRELHTVMYDANKVIVDRIKKKVVDFPRFRSERREIATEYPYVQRR